jgi:4'-phosphopantetheinyl transferase
MPLYKTITVSDSTKVYIWKIEESFEVLADDISLSQNSQNRVDSMKSDLHKRGFMSVRHLLAKAGYTDVDLYYDELGKPHLKDGNYISITHSFIFSGIIVSNDIHVGIDIEKQRDKIVKIAHKFTPIEEYKTIANHEALVRKLTIVWGAKESLYKIYEQEGLSFLQHIDLQNFSFEETKTRGIITFKNTTSNYKIHFLEFEGFTCVYAFQIEI